MQASLRNPLLPVALLCLGLAAGGVRAQTPGPSGYAEPAVAGYTTAELDQMLAPIALYPDVLLSTVLIAATYPLEVVQAARWSRANPGLTGEAAVAAVAREDWDPAVKALVAFPDILQQLDADLDWTQALGEAFLYQEAAVMDSVQHLRNRAADAGQLRTDEHVRVVRTERTVVIEPVRERVVFVPWYDPWVVYGSWWHPWHPPVVWHAPAYFRPVRSGFHWSSGFVVSPGFFFSTVHWPQRHVLVVHQPRYVFVSPHRPRPSHYVPGKRWHHQPYHRRGVDYRQPELRQRYTASQREPTRRHEGDRRRIAAPAPGGEREPDRRAGWSSGSREGRESDRQGRSREQRPASSGERLAGGSAPGSNGLASSWQGRDGRTQTGARRAPTEVPAASTGEQRSRERLAPPAAAQPRRGDAIPRVSAPAAGQPPRTQRAPERQTSRPAVPAAPPPATRARPEGRAPDAVRGQSTAPRERRAAAPPAVSTGGEASPPRARVESPPARPVRPEGAAQRGSSRAERQAPAGQFRGGRSREPQ